MTLAKRQIPKNYKARTVKIGGDSIPIIMPSFEISEDNWNRMQEIVKEIFHSNKAKSRALRILVNAVILGIIDLKELESEVEKKAEKSKDVIYI